MGELRREIKHNMDEYGIGIRDLAEWLCKSESQVRRLIRAEGFRYKDLRMLADILNFSDEQKARVL